MATFEESFLYPLVLLLVGAGVSGGLVAWLTNRWEDRRKEREFAVENRRKELEIKVDIASRMAEAIGYQIANAMTVAHEAKVEFTAAQWHTLYENHKKYFADTNIIRSKLETYFSGAGVNERWDCYIPVLMSLDLASAQYFLKPRSEKEEFNLKFSLELIRNYFSDDSRINWDRLTTDYDEHLWQEITSLVSEQGDEIIKDVLNLPIKVF
jgi:hypothetical protein